MTIPSPELFDQYLKISQDIDQKLENIRKDTCYQSSPSYIIDHPDFKDLESMGDKIISYIIHHMLSTGSTWVHLHLLHSIAPENPVKTEHAGKYIHQTADWLQWYVSSEYYKRDNIYHNLI